MKCHWNKKRTALTVCPAMKRIVRFDGHIGLFYVIVTNLKTMAERCIGIRAKNGLKDNGVMLNVCPFCIADISNWADVSKKG